MKGAIMILLIGGLGLFLSTYAPRYFFPDVVIEKNTFDDKGSYHIEIHHDAIYVLHHGKVKQTLFIEAMIRDGNNSHIYNCIDKNGVFHTVEVKHTPRRQIHTIIITNNESKEVIFEKNINL